MALKKEVFNNLFYNKKFVLAFSLVIAFVFWLVITITENPERDVTFSDLTIAVSTEGTAAGDLGLDVISMSSPTASVKISGPSYVLASLSPSNISVSASLAEVNEAGTFDLNLTAACANESSVKIVSITPSKITAQFDYTDTKLYNVEVEAVGAAAVSGLVVDTPSVSNSSDSTISISGARSELEKIARVVAVADVNDTLSITKSFDSSIHLYDIDGNELDVSNYTLSSSKIKITVPILKQKQVSVKVTFSNKPDGYADRDISHTVSASKVTIMGPEGSVDEIDSISLTPIDFNSISVDSNSFDVAPILPNGIKTAENIETITVKINTQGLIEANFDVTNFSFNVPNNYKVSALGLKNVKLCGPRSAIKEITSDDLYAVADLSGKTAGEYTIPVKVYSKTYNTVWQVGTYEVVVTVK